MSTTSGDVEVAVPKLRRGSFFPSLLTPRRTRKVDDLVVALGADSGISKSEVSRICAGIDEEVGVWLARPLDHIAFPYVFLDATYLKARVGGTGPRRKGAQVVSQAAVIAVGVSADGCREVLGTGGGMECLCWQACWSLPVAGRWLVSDDVRNGGGGSPDSVRTPQDSP